MPKSPANKHRYSLVAQTLHWGLAAGLWAMFLFGRQIAHMEVSFDNLHLFARHKSLGILILAFVLFRLIWRFISPPPPIATHEALANWGHRALYALMLATPFFGWIASSASGFEMRFFNLFPIPFLTGESERIEALFFTLHGASAVALIALSVGHAGVAIYRSAVLKDGTLRRMWPI